MLFNSYAFLLAFLPVTLAGYFSLARWSRLHAATWLAACSLFFYAWWDARYLGLLLASICLNYYAGSQIARQAGTLLGKRWLLGAVALNLTLLGYYKYADFFIGSANAAFGTEWPALGILLPIGISFFTFTQIAFLADAYAGKVTEYRFIHYVLFVTYFPHLIAGPVLHHKEMMPQFEENRNYRWNAENFAVGLSIFALGLAKKVLLADNLAPFASPIFASDAPAPGLFLAWGAALAYTFQLYFDFSGYSDMAIGLSRLFGVRLPLNFHSPYRAHNIIEFWRRWHMTLSRFLRDYLYIPLGGNRHGPARRQLNLMLTMVLGGLWHGAGWTYVLWGALHGAYLMINHAWQDVCRRLPGWPLARLSRWLGLPLTFLCVVVAWVYFRAPDLATAHRVLGGMAGLYGATIPEPILSRLGPLQHAAQAMGITATLGGGARFAEMWAWVVAAATIAFAMPNTQQIMARFKPALAQAHEEPHLPRRLAWAPTRRNAIAYGLLFGAGLLALSRPSEFLYFQF